MSTAYTLVAAAFALYLFGAIGALVALGVRVKARRVLEKVALAAAVLGGTLNLVALVREGLTLGRFPAATEREALVLGALCIALVEVVNFLVLRLRTTLGPSLLLAAGYLFGGAVVHGTLYDVRVMPEILGSGWFAPHLVAYFVGYAYLAQAGLGALLYPLVRRRGADAAGRLVRELRARACLGFPFLTIGLVIGSLWAQDAWADYWGRDPKETWALVTWLVYAAYLHLALRSEREARRALPLLVVGFAAFMFTWLGVKILPSTRAGSLHTYTDSSDRR